MRTISERELRRLRRADDALRTIRDHVETPLTYMDTARGLYDYVKKIANRPEVLPACDMCDGSGEYEHHESGAPMACPNGCLPMRKSA